MDLIARLPLLSFEPKTTEHGSVDFERPIKRFILKNYPEEDPMSFHTNIREIESLRHLAVNAGRDENGLYLLKKYYAQLYSLNNRLKRSRDETVMDELRFEWRDVYDDSEVVRGDIGYELLCILYNIALLLVELGASADRSTDNQMQSCCSHFQTAAAAFDLMNEQQGVYRSRDMARDLIRFMSCLSIAQAQECILEKSMSDNKMPSVVAKLAAQVSECYSSCQMILLSCSGSGSGSATNFVDKDSNEFKEWKKYTEFKISYFSSLAAYFKGTDCFTQKTKDDKPRMGEAIAWFSSTEKLLIDAKKLSKGFDRSGWSNTMNDAMKKLTDLVTKKQEAAKKENDFIYHDKIPRLEELTAIQGIPVAKAKGLDLTDPTIMGPDIFGKMVPLEEYVALSLYTEMKDGLLREIGLEIERKNLEIEELLSGLNLPASTSVTSKTPTSLTTAVSLRPKISPVPQELCDIVAHLSLSDFIESVEKKIFVLDEKSSSIKTVITRIQKSLEVEKQAEVVHQRDHGKRAESSLISNLERDLQKLIEKEATAASESLKIKESFESSLPLLREIEKHGKNDQINALLPGPGDIPVDEANILQLERLLSKVNEMKIQRINYEDGLKERVRKDDILAKVVMVGEDEEKLRDLFDRELKKFQESTDPKDVTTPTVKVIRMNLTAQDNIRDALIKACADYKPTRKAILDVEKKRKEKADLLINSYERIKKLVSRGQVLDTAYSFYDKIHAELSSLEGKVKSVCTLHSEERDRQRKKCVASPLNSMASIGAPLNLSGNYIPGQFHASVPSSSTPKLKDYLMNRNAVQTATPYQTSQPIQPTGQVYNQPPPPNPPPPNPPPLNPPPPNPPVSVPMQYPYQASQVQPGVPSSLPYNYSGQYSAQPAIPPAPSHYPGQLPYQPQPQPTSYSQVSSGYTYSAPNNGYSSANAYQQQYPSNRYNSYGNQQQPYHGSTTYPTNGSTYPTDGSSQQPYHGSATYPTNGSSQQPYQQYPLPRPTDLLSEPVESVDLNPVLSPTQVSPTSEQDKSS